MKRTLSIVALMVIYFSVAMSQSFDDKWSAAIAKKNNQDYAGAITAFTNLLNDCGVSGVSDGECKTQIYTQMARCYFETKDYANMGIIAQKAIDLGALTVFPFVYLAYSKWLSQSDFDGAVAVITTGAAKFPNNADLNACASYIYRERGNVDFDKENYGSAMEFFNKALSFEEKGTTYACIGDVHYVRENYSSAVSSYQKAIDLGYVKNGDTYADLGNSYYALQSYTSAANSYVSAINSGNNDLETYVYLAFCYYTLEQYSDCKWAINKAYGVDASVFSSYDNLRQIYDYVKQY